MPGLSPELQAKLEELRKNRAKVSGQPPVRAIIDLTDPNNATITFEGKWRGLQITTAQRLLRREYRKYLIKERKRMQKEAANTGD